MPAPTICCEYRNVTPHNVTEIVHGAIFTRSPDDLWRTAIFLGGSDVAAAEAVLEQIRQTFFGPLRVSVLIDPAGSNTTAAAAVLAAAKHVPLSNTTVTVLAGTGPVGQRCARLLAREGAIVRVASRNLQRAQAVCDTLTPLVDNPAFGLGHAQSGRDTGRARWCPSSDCRGGCGRRATAGCRS